MAAEFDVFRLVDHTRIDCLPQGEVRFDSLLDMVKRETEFRRQTTWSRAPRVGIPRRNIASDVNQFFAPEA